MPPFDPATPAGSPAAGLRAPTVAAPTMLAVPPRELPLAKAVSAVPAAAPPLPEMPAPLAELANSTKWAGKVRSITAGGGVGTEMLTGWGTVGGTVASSAATAVLLPAPVLRPVVEVA